MTIKEVSLKLVAPIYTGCTMLLAQFGGDIEVITKIVLNLSGALSAVAVTVYHFKKIKKL